MTHSSGAGRAEAPMRNTVLKADVTPKGLCIGNGSSLNTDSGRAKVGGRKVCNMRQCRSGNAITRAA